jgi:hypothetical protein
LKVVLAAINVPEDASELEKSVNINSSALLLLDDDAGRNSKEEPDGGDD